MTWHARRLVVCAALCVGGVAFAQEEPPLEDFDHPSWKSPLKQLNVKLDLIQAEVEGIDCDEYLVTSVDGLVSEVVIASASTNTAVHGVYADLELAYAGFGSVQATVDVIDHTVAAAAIECGVAEFTCSNGVLQGTVNGREFTRNCFEYACDGGSCRTGCGGDGDCAEGFFCSDGGECQVVQGAICGGPYTVGTLTFYTSSIDARGFEDSCSPFTCEGGACRTSCASSADCVVGTSCSAGLCVGTHP